MATPNRFSRLLAIALIGGCTLASAGYAIRARRPAASRPPSKTRLYWFVPDGFRADPDLIQLFKWAEQGLLPNIGTLVRNGVSGYSLPVFPGHTPTNFATLMTGTMPDVHGVADGAMRLEGYPLKMVARGGFSSVAKKVAPIWYTLEEQRTRVGLLSVPGSTPPELNEGVTIRGRWGGWGLEFPAINFHSARDGEFRKQLGLDSRVFRMGSELTRFAEATDPRGWQARLPRSYSPPREVEIVNWGSVLHAYIYDSRDDGREEYDHALFSFDKRSILADLPVGGWSDWSPIILSRETANDYMLDTPKKMAWERELSAQSVQTEFKICVIKLGAKDFFRFRLFYDNLNEYLVKPADLASEIIAAVGPMVDFPDNYPPQLVFYPEDKRAFLDEARMSIDWHRRAVAWMMRDSGSEVVIHSIYTPNQLLTSRWWLPGLDPRSASYASHSEAERKELWADLLEMYRGIDGIVGEILAHAGPETTIVLSSDHGAIPLNQEVRINNLFAREGLLKFRMDAATGSAEIDWKNSQAVFIQMDNVYVNPEGLGGSYRRVKGPRYLALRERVQKLLAGLRDADGKSPVGEIVPWEEAGRFHLPEDRVGDLVIANTPGFAAVENITEDLEIFKKSLKGGYKQGVPAEQEKGMWTPFIAMGPGIPKGVRIERPLRHVDQYATIMRLLGKRMPPSTQGKPIPEVFGEK